MIRVDKDIVNKHLNTIYEKINEKEKFIYYSLPTDMMNPERDCLVYTLNQDGYECSHYSTGVLWISWMKKKLKMI